MMFHIFLLKLPLSSGIFPPATHFIKHQKSIPQLQKNIFFFNSRDPSTFRSPPPPARSGGRGSVPRVPPGRARWFPWEATEPPRARCHARPRLAPEFAAIMAVVEGKVETIHEIQELCHFFMENADDIYGDPWLPRPPWGVWLSGSIVCYRSI